MCKTIFKIIVLLAFSPLAICQNTLPTPKNIEATYSKNTRSIDGTPGKNYWQNSAKYDINVEFKPDSRILTGSEEIIYTNNSPDTLKVLVFKLYQNIYKKGAMRLSTIKDSDVSDGVSIGKTLINDQIIDPNNIKIYDTNMFIRIKPLSPKQSATVKLEFSYVLNKESHIRTGQVDDGAFFIGYFFPRIAVYDDIDGWNTFPYFGSFSSQEFYNDFCDFKVAIKVPNDYLVWATGDLQNCSDVLNNKYCDRIIKAEKNDAISFIIDSTDIKTDDITKKKSTENIWKYEAQNVTDIAFATSNHYVWESSSVVVDKKTGRRTRVDAVYNPEHTDFLPIASIARKTVEAMSFHYPKWPYPYNHETVFDGLSELEFPMMVNDHPEPDKTKAVGVTSHEIFHTMFPFYMGTNETKYAWMDEGWATTGDWLLSPIIDPSITDEFGIAQLEELAGTESDFPITTLSTQLNDFSSSLFINSYPKAAFGYLFVKDLLGDELFYKALHHYIATWNGKHPMPNDFFYSMNEGSGQNLNWFWKKWFFEGGDLDLSISKVNGKEITIENKSEKPLPIDLNITFIDGSTEKIHFPISIWKSSNKTTTMTTKSNVKIKKIVLGSTYIPDSNKSNNVYEN